MSGKKKKQTNKNVLNFFFSLQNGKNGKGKKGWGKGRRGEEKEGKEKGFMVTWKARLVLKTTVFDDIITLSLFPRLSNSFL